MKINLKNKKIDQKPESFVINFTKWIGSGTSMLAHTIFFTCCFLSVFFGFKTESVLLFLTTIVSLEAIYLAIIIQMTVNRNTEELRNVGEDIDEIQEDIDEIQEDIDEIQEDVDEIEEGDTEEEKRDRDIQKTIDKISSSLESFMKDLENLKTKK